MIMRKYIVLWLMLGLSVLGVSASTDSLLVRDHSDSIRVSLVTCSPGTEVYAVYGHTALRIEVPSDGIDVVVNYGLFDFDAPNFLWKFVRGNTDYVVGALGYPIFEREYIERGSSVTLQELNLSETEKVALIKSLDKNLLPENREYRYNFLYNNCSTKARDKVEEVLGCDVVLAETDTVATYRSIIHQYTADYPWLQFGIDYLLGLEADRPIGAREQMFAPEYLKDYTAATQLVVSGRTYPYVASERVVEPIAPQPDTFTFMLTPMQLMILLLLFTACVCTLEYLVERRQWWYDVLLLLVQGVMGCVVAFLFFFSGHPTVGSNLHVIYLNPLPLLFIPFIVRDIVKGRKGIFSYVLGALLVIFVGVSLLTRQYIQPAAYVLVAAWLLRVVHNVWLYPWVSRLLARRKAVRSRGTHIRAVSLLLPLLVPAMAQADTNGNVPKVVVGIVVDQLRADYLEKYAHLYGEDGFKKLFAEGRVYTNGYFDHAGPDRSSAVASVYSGSTPYYHGITGNRFLERKSMRVLGAVDDASYAGINTSAATSPARLLVTTVTDELKLATKGHAYVLSVAPERDMAVLAGGHAPNAVIWLAEDKAMWASSDYYNGVPAWVRPFNHRIGTHFDWSNVEWEPYYPTGVYSYSAYDGVPKAFRHTFRGGDAETVRRYKTSACVNDEVTQLAQACIAGSLFGRNKTTDMLCVGYYAGNYEHLSEWEYPLELQDIYCRLDRNIADLLRAVDEKVGIDNALFFITSTGYSDAYVPDSKYFTLPTGELKMDRCVALLNMYLGALYGKDSYVEGSYLNELYLNHSLIEKRQLKMKELLDRCTEFLSQMAGVKRVYPSLDLLSGSADASVRNSYNAERSGDLILEVSPGWTLVDDRWGERICYNRAHVPVPVILYGAGLTPAISRSPIAVESVAPTVSHILRISVPNGCSARPVE